MSEWSRNKDFETEVAFMTIKLQEFAKQQGVTDRQVQRLLKKYEAELEGLFERKGPNGTWLTDEACELLRGKMRQQPIAVFEEDPRVQRLEERVRELEMQVSEKDKMLSLAHQQVQASQEKVAQLQEAEKTIARLEANKEVAEAERRQIEEQNAALQQELERKAESERALAERAVKSENRLSEATKEFEDKEYLMQQEIEQLRSRKWYQLLFKKNKE